MDRRAQVTLLLRSAQNGNVQRDDRAADTLRPTGLVHEADMRLSPQSP